MGDLLFTTKAIKEAAACLGGEMKIRGDSSNIIFSTDIIHNIKVLNPRDAELALNISHSSFVGNIIIIITIMYSQTSILCHPLGPRESGIVARVA